MQLPLLALGVGSAVAAWPLALDLLRLAGGAYLVWLGARLVLAARSGGGRAHGAAPARGTTAPWAAVRQGAVSNLTNPKPLLFMLASLPQFVDLAAGPVTAQLLALGATQRATGLLVQGAVATCAGATGALLARRPGLLAWQERTAGAAWSRSG